MNHSIMRQYRQRFVRFGQRMNEDTPFFSNAIVHWISIAVGVIALIVLTLLFLNIEVSSSLVKLQYNIYFGASVQAAWWSPYALSAVGLLFFLLDLGLAWMLYKARERIAAYSLLLGGLFAHIALLVATISIVLNN